MATRGQLVFLLIGLIIATPLAAQQTIESGCSNSKDDSMI